MSVLRPILAHALRSPGKTAIVDDNRSYSFAQLIGAAMFVAEKLDASTANPHVGLLLPTGGGFPVALLGAWLARRVAVPLNYLLNPSELEYVIRDSGIDTLITAGPLLSFIGGRDILPPDLKVIYLEKMDFAGFPPLRWPPIHQDDDLACLLYTSGTSGKPKGVMLTHCNLESNVRAGLAHAGITSDDVLMGVLPQFHSFGLTALTLMPLAAGAKVVYTARFLPKKIVSLLKKHQPTCMMAIPSMWGALLSVKDAGPDDFKSLRFAISGGEPLPHAVFDEFENRLHVRLLEGYGLTETAPVTNWCTADRWKLHSVGVSLPGVQILIVDDKDQLLPPGVDGEVLVAGPNVMKGYYHLPEITAQAINHIQFHPDQPPLRVLRTGDIGHVDNEGFLFITGRKKEMLIVGGENVFPREIEEVLNEHPSVKDSAVIGRRDDVRGELPAAFVEINDGFSFNETELRSWCRDRLAGYKVPRDIQQVETLPRNATGKILRRVLKEQHSTPQGNPVP